MKFPALPKNNALTIGIRGQSKYGKTYLSNTFNTIPNSVVADTHRTRSTVETMKILNNSKLRRIRTFDELDSMATEFAVEYKPNSSFVLDSGSDIVNLAMLKYKEQHGKNPFEFTWQTVWDYIKTFMETVTGSGNDLILTLMMKRRRNEQGEIIPGVWQAHEWKDLEYHASAMFSLQRGVQIGQKLWFPYRIFVKVDSNRFSPIGSTKPMIVGSFTRPNVLEQLQHEYRGTIKDVLNEYYHSLYDSEYNNDVRFCRDIKELLGPELKEADSVDDLVGDKHEKPVQQTEDELIISSENRDSMEI
ncbi:hypothetical protein CMI37_20010 [Candidatus Pacearchaeota archaeon]|nr:hypothetical protein [Candidatus Pacearchaeota archaeon]|tara:strand:- start:1 stop:909 length:909 start_codon:yes stop_codon:yes gene_type:complete